MASSGVGQITHWKAVQFGELTILPIVLDGFFGIIKKWNRKKKNY